MDAHNDHRQERGQVLVISAFAIVVLLMITGLILDGGFGLAQRRVAQNGADLAALAGARVIASFVSGDTTNGTDANVVASIDTTVAANHLPVVTYGAPDGPRYVDVEGNQLAYVGSGTIPAGTAGVTVKTTKSWKPFFAGLFGVSQWSTNADATARGGYRAGGPPIGNLLPIGVSRETYNSFPVCAAGTPTASCTVVDLTEGTHNIPGGFGWLKFGCGGETDDNGNPYGLGQNDDGCENNKPFLAGEWGNLGATPPVPPNTYGCCTEVGLPGSGDDIGSLPGNKASMNDSDPGVAYYINNEVVGFVPIWDYAGGTGSNGYYHIIGFAGFQITHVKGSKDIQGILRQVIFPGPVSTEAPGFAGAPLATQLIR
jgi:hypothetical protein